MLFKPVNNTIIKAADGKDQALLQRQNKAILWRHGEVFKRWKSDHRKTVANNYELPLNSINIIRKGTQRKNQEKKQQDLSLETVPCIKFSPWKDFQIMKNYTINDQFLPPPAIVALISESSSSSPRIAS